MLMEAIAPDKRGCGATDRAVVVLCAHSAEVKTGDNGDDTRFHLAVCALAAVAERQKPPPSDNKTAATASWQRHLNQKETQICQRIIALRCTNVQNVDTPLVVGMM